MSQTKKILSHLRSGKSITPVEALKKYGCFRLAARINDLRKSNNIKTVIVERNGKRFAAYHLKTTK